MVNDRFKEFLMNQESSFFHITTIPSWNSIQNEGLKADNYGRIFVSIDSHLSILLGIAFLQIPEIYEKGFVILRIPQEKISISINSISEDRQTNEWTKDFQCVIYKDVIPLESIEFLGEIDFGNYNEENIAGLFIRQYLNKIQEYGQIYFEKYNLGEKFDTLEHNKIAEIIVKFMEIENLSQEDDVRIKKVINFLNSLSKMPNA
jgi:hypothetical protein